MLKPVVEGEGQAWEELLRDGDGEAVKVPVLCPDHDHARLVDGEVVLGEEGVQVLEGGVGATGLASLRSHVDEVQEF